MTSSQQGAQARGRACSCCGGSGVLRTEAVGYRTCLECLGQGQTPVFETVFGLPDPAAPPVAEPRKRWPRAACADISASISGAR